MTEEKYARSSLGCRMKRDPVGRVPVGRVSLVLCALLRPYNSPKNIF